MVTRINRFTSSARCAITLRTSRFLPSRIANTSRIAALVALQRRIDGAVFYAVDLDAFFQLIELRLGDLARARTR